MEDIASIEAEFWLSLESASVGPVEGAGVWVEGVSVLLVSRLQPEGSWAGSQSACLRRFTKYFGWHSIDNCRREHETRLFARRTSPVMQLLGSGSWILSSGDSQVNYSDDESRGAAQVEPLRGSSLRDLEREHVARR